MVASFSALVHDVKDDQSILGVRKSPIPTPSSCPQRPLLACPSMSLQLMAMGRGRMSSNSSCVWEALVFLMCSLIWDNQQRLLDCGFDLSAAVACDALCHIVRSQESKFEIFPSQK